MQNNEKQAIVAGLIEMLNLNNVERGPTPPFFLTPDCIPQSRWIAFLKTTKEGQTWEWTGSERGHIEKCSICERRERAVVAEVHGTVVNRDTFNETTQQTESVEPAKPNAFVSQPASSTRSKFWRSRWLSVAASIAFLLGIGAVGWKLTPSKFLQPTEVTTSLGVRADHMGNLPPSEPAIAPIRLHLPPHHHGTITILKVAEDGSVSVVPRTDAASQVVAADRPEPTVTIQTIFNPADNRGVTLWLLLTEHPATELLRSWAATVSPNRSFHKRIPSSALKFLWQYEIGVPVFGRFAY